MTRYGRHNIGFFWVFGEPAIFCIGVIILRHLKREDTQGLPLTEFVLTGYSTVLLWRNCGNKCCNAITPNLSLLYHRNVRAVDCLLSRIILEISGCAMAFLMLVVVLITAGLIRTPDSWTLLVAGYLMNAWFAMSVGIWVCACSELSEVFERIWHPITYFMLPISGLFFMVQWLPYRWQKVLELVPMVAGCEMLRDGYFGKEIHCHYSVGYLSCWCLGLTFIGLALLKVFARDAQPQ